MKILHLIYDDMKNPWCGGGGAVRAYEINRRLARRHDITVVTGNYPGARDEVVEGIKYERIGSNRSYLLSRISFSLYSPLLLKRLKYDILINDFSVFSPCFATLHSKKPMITMVHHLVSYHAISKYCLAGFFPLISEEVNLHLSKDVITASLFMEQRIRQKLGPKINIKGINNGVSNIQRSSESAAKEDSVLFLGRIDIYMKGLDILIESFSRVSPKYWGLKLKIVGPGKPKDIEKIKRLIVKFNAGNIEILGRVSEDEKAQLLANSKIVCLPSRFEGWGIVAIEAAMAGKPVIGTRIPGLSDAIRDEETGMLIQPDNPNELAAAMTCLLENKEKRRRLGENGRKWARRFNWDKTAKEQEQFYQRVLTRYLQ